MQDGLEKAVDSEGKKSVGSREKQHSSIWKLIVLELSYYNYYFGHYNYYFGQKATSALV